MFQTEEQKKAKIIQSLIHEGMHLGFRTVTNNFLNVTLCIANPTENPEMADLEGGYRLEELIWGKHNIAFYHPNYVDRVFKPEHWKKEEPLFSDILALPGKKHYRSFSNAYCSGLELMEDDIIFDFRDYLNSSEFTCIDFESTH